MHRPSDRTSEFADPLLWPIIAKDDAELSRHCLRKPPTGKGLGQDEGLFIWRRSLIRHQFCKAAKLSNREPGLVADEPDGTRAPLREEKKTSIDNF